MIGITLSDSGISSWGQIPKTVRTNKGKSLCLFPENCVVLDMETTGLDPRFDEIIEFGAIKIRNNQIMDSFSTLIQPTYPIDTFITDLTGITNEMLESAPSIEIVLPEILNFIGEDIIVGHNVNFDINFLYDISNGALKNNFVDTLRLSRKIRKDLPNHKLATLVEAFQIPSETSHRALADAEQTFQCLIALKNYAEKHNIDILPFPKYAPAKSITPKVTVFNEPKANL